MIKVCCVEDANVSPKLSSCSMVLRSACSHKHSRESPTVKHFHSSIDKRSLNGLNQQFFEISSLNVTCAKEDCSATESDMNSSASLNTTSSMSQRFTRSSISLIRSDVPLSDEDESEITVEKIRRPNRNSSEDFKKRKNTLSREEMKNLYLSNSHSHTERHQSVNNSLNRFNGGSDGDNLISSLTESAHLDNSSVQYSLFDRFRWFLWRYIYLKMIQIINFDVWLLSRINNHGKLKFFLFLLLPLLFILAWRLPENNALPMEAVYETSNSIISTIFSILFAVTSFISSTFSSIHSYFIRQEGVFTESEISDGSCLQQLEIFSKISSSFAIFYRWFGKFGENAHSTFETKPAEEPPPREALYPHDEETKYFHTSREEIKNEINSIKEFVQKSESENLKKDQELQKEISALHLKFQSLSETVGRLEKDIMKLSENVETNNEALKKEYKKDIEHLSKRLKTINEAKLGVLEQIKSCCDKQWSEDDLAAVLEKHVILAFKNVVDGDSELPSKYNFFTEWLNSKFFSHDKLKQEINAALKRQSSSSSDSKVNFDSVTQVVESTVLKYVESIKRNLSEISKSTYSSFSEDIFSEDRIKKIVKEAIMLYDADKIGQVDYALESGGGSVLGTRCSETYVEKYGKLSIFGVPLWTNSNSPRTAIQPDVQPGRCWAFKGSQGFLVLELSATIYPTGFTLEHIPVSLSPSGSIDSAPKNFSVWGLDSERDSKGYLLGEYVYNIYGDPLQYFAVQIPSDKSYTYIELQVHSNHGNMEYTCLYRFRVHGNRVR